MSVASYAVWFRGHRACPCLAEWLPVFEAELLRRGVIRHSIDVAQLIGNAPASAGVHSRGGAFDVWQHDPTTQLVGREMGAATWNRLWEDNEHTHGVLKGCPHNAPARYQIAALAAGYDGTGSGGRGARDTGPGPRELRTWREGIAWARAQQPQPTRGEAVDDALAALKRARGAGRRAELIARARRLLRRVPLIGRRE